MGASILAALELNNSATKDALRMLKLIRSRVVGVTKATSCMIVLVEKPVDQSTVEQVALGVLSQEPPMSVVNVTKIPTMGIISVVPRRSTLLLTQRMTKITALMS